MCWLNQGERKTDHFSQIFHGLFQFPRWFSISLTVKRETQTYTDLKCHFEALRVELGGWCIYEKRCAICILGDHRRDKKCKKSNRFRVILDFVTSTKSANLSTFSTFLHTSSAKTMHPIKKLTDIKSSCIFEIYKSSSYSFALSSTVWILQFLHISKCAKKSHLHSKFRHGR